MGAQLFRANGQTHDKANSRLFAILQTRLQSRPTLGEEGGESLAGVAGPRQSQQARLVQAGPLLLLKKTWTMLCAVTALSFCTYGSPSCTSTYRHALEEWLSPACLLRTYTRHETVYIRTPWRVRNFSSWTPLRWSWHLIHWGQTQCCCSQLHIFK